MTRYPAVQADFGWAFTLENRRIPTKDVSMCQVILLTFSLYLSSKCITLDVRTL